MSPGKEGLRPFGWTMAILAVLLTTSSLLVSADEEKAVKARVESCTGWLLNRLPDVKRFIYEDVPQYEDVTFKAVPGAPPKVVLLDKDDNEIKKLNLKELSQEECNHLLLDLGFQKKEEKPDREL